MGSQFSFNVGFSRDGPNKVYVQHLMKEKAKEINELLEKQKAYLYVCGDAANMARDVSSLLGQIIAQERGISESKGEEIVKQMRASGQYQEDVWS
jgi:NADPH-ferrihemoprotein reductase